MKEQILSELEQLWKKYPQLRFGQLVSNIQSASCKGKMDLFYVEDEDMIKGIKILLSAKENEK
jgi:hypothetical protein